MAGRPSDLANTNHWVSSWQCWRCEERVWGPIIRVLYRCTTCCTAQVYTVHTVQGTSPGTAWHHLNQLGPTNTLGNSVFFKIFPPLLRRRGQTSFIRGMCSNLSSFVKCRTAGWWALVPGTAELGLPEKTKITMQRWASHNSNCQGQSGEEIIVPHFTSSVRHHDEESF